MSVYYYSDREIRAMGHEPDAFKRELRQRGSDVKHPREFDPVFYTYIKAISPEAWAIMQAEWGE